MTGIESARNADAVFQTELDNGLIFAPVLLAAETQFVVSGRRAQNVFPINFFEGFSHFGGSHSRRIHSADDAAHTRSGNVINRNAIFLEPFEHADVRDAARAAPR